MNEKFSQSKDLYAFIQFTSPKVGGESECLHITQITLNVVRHFTAKDNNNIGGKD